MLHDHGSLNQPARNLLGCTTFLYCQSVFGKLHSIDVVKRAPEKIVPAIILNEKRVDAVLYPYFAGYEQLVSIMETTVGSVADSHADATFPCLSPLRLRIVKHILPIDIVDVGSPDAAVGHEIHRACGICKRRSGIPPCDKVFGAIDRYVVRIFCGIEIEIAISVFDDCWVRKTIFADRIMIHLHYIIAIRSDRERKRIKSNQDAIYPTFHFAG